MLETRTTPAIIPMAGPMAEGYLLGRFPIESADMAALNLHYQPLAVSVASPANNATLSGDTTVTGRATSGNIPAITLTEQVDSTGAVTVPLDSAGNFSFPLSNLSNGSHIVTLTASDPSGRSASQTVNVTVNTSVPTITSFDLDAASDTGVTGDHLTNKATVTLVGVTKAGSTVVLGNTGASTTADSSGNFTFAGLALSAASTTFNLTATDSGGRTATFSRTITLDTVAPTLSVALANDTGVSSTDGITSDSSVNGTTSDDSGTVQSLVVGLDNSGTFPLDVTSRIAAGAFAITAADVNTLAGGTLSAGSHTLNFQATDAAGNVTTQNLTFTFVVGPATPTLDLDAGTDTGTVGDHKSLLANVTLVGTTSAGASVVLTDSSNNTIASGTADGSGNFSFTSVALAAGNNTFTVTATNAANVTSSFTRTIVRDSVPPTLTVALADDTGASNTDGITSDDSIAGTAVDGADAVTALIGSFDADTTLGNNLISHYDATAHTFALSASDIATLLGGTVSDGAHTLHIRAQDAAGNTTDMNLSFTLDTTIAAPSFDLDAASDTGTVGDHETNLATVTLTGATELGAAVVVKDASNNTIGTGAADGSGNFSITNVPLAAGANVITVFVTDVAGNTNSTTLTITRDSTGPTLTAGLADDTGRSPSDGITNDPSVAGTALDGVLAAPSLEASLDADNAFDTDVTASVQADGSFTISAATLDTLAGGILSDGSHTLHLKASDGAGNFVTKDVTFTFDSSIATPTLDLAAGSDTGTVGDHHTSLAGVTLVGVTEANASVALKDGTGNILSTTTADGSGNFSFAATLALGDNTFDVVATDAAGNTALFQRVVSRDDAGPALAAALVNDTGASNTDGVTSDPTISGTVAPSAVTNQAVTGLAVALDNGSFVDATGIVSGGSFTVTPSQLTSLAGGTLADGAHTLHIVAVDAGNDATQVDVAFTLDTTLAVPTLDLDPASDTGTLGDDRTSLANVTLSGTIADTTGVSLILLDGSNNVLSSTTPDADGKFSFNGPLALGDNTFTVVAVDLAGNQQSFTRVVTRANGPSLAAALANDTGSSPTDGITSDITIAGTVTTPPTTSIVSLTGTLDGSATPIDLTSQLFAGAFTISSVDLGSPSTGAHTLDLTALNNLGDATTVTVSFNFDNATATPTLDLDPNFDDGTVGDHQTSLPTVTLAGSAEAGATIALTDGVGTPLATATAAADGTFSFTSVALALGDNTFIVTATDVAGNQASFTQTVTRYAVTPVVTAALTQDTGVSATDGLTSNPEITGSTSEPNGFILGLTVQLDGAPAIDASSLVQADGSFVLSASNLDFLAGGTLAQGAHSVHFQATGSAGTVVDATVDFTFDNVGDNPTLGLDPSFGFGDPAANTTDQSTVSLLGVADPNVTVTLTDSQQNVLGTTTSDGSGNYSFANIAVVAGDNSFTVSIPADDAGNVGTVTTVVHRNSAPTVLAAIPDATLTSTDTQIDLAANFTDPDISDSIVTFTSNQGTFSFELFDQQDPQTVANFLDYVQNGSYNDTFFHRLADDPQGNPFILQGGGFTLNNGVFGTVPALPAVANEFHFSNTAGTLAMAKIPAVDDAGNPIPGGGPDSATNQFFVNLEDNSSTLDSQNGGFTVFGVLATTADAQTVINLKNTPVYDASFGSPNSPFTSLPLVNYTGDGTNFPDDALNNFIVVTNVAITKRTEQLTYSIVGNTNPALATVSLNPNANERLTVHLNDGQTGSSVITVRATDRAGDFVDQSFTVSA